MNDGKHLQRDRQDMDLLEHGTFCECIWCIERDINVESEDSSEHEHAADPAVAQV